MNQDILDNALALRVPLDMRAWLSTLPSIDVAWSSCDDPSWLVALARVADLEVRHILRALARCFPDWPRELLWSERELRIDSVLREAIKGYALDGPSESTTRDLERLVLPQLRDWNISRSEPNAAEPARELWAFISRTNAIMRLHMQSSDHVRWPWPGRLDLVVAWLVQVSVVPNAVLPYDPATLQTLHERDVEHRTRLAARLRALLRPEHLFA